ncbi:MAG: RluA family pseudouridine synthase [Actinomycetota bacterium]
MSEPLRLTLGPDDAGTRLDKVLASRLERGRGEVASWFSRGVVTLDGTPVKPSTKGEEGQQVLIEPPEEPVQSPTEQAEAPAARILYEDDSLLIVDKPAGLVVHPAPGHRGPTLVDQLAKLPDPPAGGDPDRPGIVHRLDKDTSGLLLVARTPETHAELSAMMKRRAITRRYIAALDARLDNDAVTVDAPIGRDPRHRTRMAVVAQGREAVTHFELVERIASVSIVHATLETGRTHQIRVHAAAIDAPVLGDETYGGAGPVAKRVGLSRPYLHAEHLRFVHPTTGEAVSFESSLPPELADTYHALKRLEPPKKDTRPPHRRDD